MTLKTQGLQTLEQVRAFMAGSAPLDFAVLQRGAAYGFVAAPLGRFDYRRLGKADKGLSRRCLCKGHRPLARAGDAPDRAVRGHGTEISNGHLYNLRAWQTYQRRRGPFDQTRPVQRPIGERRKPRPEGRPGCIRVDTVHPGDLDGITGLYHLNPVDEVTRFQCVGSVKRI